MAALTSLTYIYYLYMYKYIHSNYFLIYIVNFRSLKTFCRLDDCGSIQTKTETILNL